MSICIILSDSVLVMLTMVLRVNMLVSILIFGIGNDIFVYSREKGEISSSSLPQPLPFRLCEG